ncbi:hypothetical protein AMTRI_Chr13g125080 [Amborella trichopoda]
MAQFRFPLSVLFIVCLVSFFLEVKVGWSRGLEEMNNGVEVKTVQGPEAMNNGAEENVVLSSREGCYPASNYPCWWCSINGNVIHLKNTARSIAINKYKCTCLGFGAWRFKNKAMWASLLSPNNNADNNKMTPASCSSPYFSCSLSLKENENKTYMQ